MAKYKSIVVTNGGLALVAAAHSGDTIEFTAVKAGAGGYDGTEVLAEATDLKDLRQTMGITGITKDKSVIKVRAVLSNEGLNEAYGITELGLYAKDSSGNEILYAIVIAETGNEDYIPAYADAPSSITFEMYIDATAYESGVTFQATVIAGTYATVQDLNDAISGALASVSSSMNTMQSSIMQEVDKKVGKEEFQESIDDVNTELDKKINTTDIVDNLESTATELPLSANQGRVTSERVDIIESTLITGINLNGRDFNNLGEKSFSGQGGNIANGPIDNTGCNYIVHQIAGGGGALLQFAKATNWGDGELLYFRQRRNNNWDKWRRVVIQEEISQRWITQSTSVKGTVTIDVNPSSAYQLFCQWNGGTTYAIYYIDMENSLVVLTNGNQGTWEVTLSADKSKINISNENGNNQYAKYRLLRLN